MKRIVAFACDHAGVALKRELTAYLPMIGDYAALNLGTDGEAPADYPDFGAAAARSVLEGAAAFGVIICGNGVGISIAANRYPGIRAALCTGGLMARLARQHNDANLLALGSRIIGVETAKDCLREFLKTPFDGGRHEKRIAKLG